MKKNTCIVDWHYDHRITNSRHSAGRCGEVVLGKCHREPVRTLLALRAAFGGCALYMPAGIVVWRL